MYFAAFLSPLLFVALTIAHGAVTEYIIAGKTYSGYKGFSPAQSGPTIQRQWRSYDPVTSVNDPKVRCNGGTSAALNAQIAAGSPITAKWGQWTHEQGPVMVWLYKCPGEFTTCDGSGRGWFKIDQMGMTAPPLSGKNWGNAKIVKDHAWTTKIPANLKSGNYLIRHELIALHTANSPQFYPECAQIVVTGGGSAYPEAKYLSPIPGYANQNDPGIMVNPYGQNAPQTYRCPGPEVWNGH